MPIYEFHQPSLPGAPELDPRHWEFQMLPPDIEGYPGEPVPLSTVGEPVYFRCDPTFLRHQCDTKWALLWDPLRGGSPTQEDVEACIQANLDQCVNILTEDLPFADGWVQVQACGESAFCSGWSEPLVVPSLPFGTSLLVGAMVMALLFRNRS